MQNIFDTHSHYTSEQFDMDRDTLLAGLPARGVTAVVDCATDYKSALEILKLCDKYQFMKCAVGIHPESVCEIDETEIDRIESLIGEKNVVAIGEIGLDYHWDMPRDLQISFFKKQLSLADKHKLPVILHDREAHQDMQDIVLKHDLRYIMHCYSGSAQMAQQLLQKGDFYFGFGGALTFKNAKKAVEAVEQIPLERILLETDCPYMAPVPFRGKRCDSSLIIYTAEVIAQIKGVTTQYALDITCQNAKRFFNLG